MNGDVAFLFGQKLAMGWCVGKEKGYEDAEQDRKDAFDNEDEWPYSVVSARILKMVNSRGLKLTNHRNQVF